MRTIDLPASCDSLLVSSAVNIRYLTGFNSVNTQEREAYLLITKSANYLITYQLYHEETEQIATRHKNVIPLYIGGGIRLVDHLKNQISHHGIQTMGIEASSLMISEYDQITSTLPFLRVIKDVHWIEPLRLQKNDQELYTLRKGCKLTDDCFQAVKPQVGEGRTELQLAWEIEKYIKEHGGSLSFAPIVAFNAHAAIPHHMPDSLTPLAINSMVLFDFGAMIDGYHADMTRVIFFGKPQAEWTKAYRVVLKAQQKVITYLKTEKEPHGSEADRIAQKVITDAGYHPYPHGLGHGVGLEIHESPRLSIHRDEVIKPGMVFSIEPGIYVPGKFGIRIEDLAQKTENGIELLSHSPYLL